MSRNDNLLNTGATSASFGSAQEQKLRAAKRDEKVEKRIKLLPSSDIIKEVLDAEMHKVMLVQGIDIAGAKDERMFMIEMMARQKYVGFIKDLQNKLDIILREKPIKAKSE